MTTLRDQVIRLAYQHEDMRADLLKTLPVFDHTSELPPRYAFLKNAKGDSVKEFIKQHGDEKVKNPNPESRDKTPEVKVKSLPNSEEGKGLFQKLFDRFKGDGDKGESSDDSSKEKQKLVKKFKEKAKDQDMMTFWREVKKDKSRDSLIDKDDVKDLFKKDIDKAIEMYLKNPPANAPKKPSMKDIAHNWSKKRHIKARQALIRLAFHNPSYRSRLLPVILAHDADARENLREAMIRTAYENPELREALLPLITKNASDVLGTLEDLASMGRRIGGITSVDGPHKEYGGYYALNMSGPNKSARIWALTEGTEIWAEVSQGQGMFQDTNKVKWAGTTDAKTIARDLSKMM
jgi:hypothetical protein